MSESSVVPVAPTPAEHLAVLRPAFEHRFGRAATLAAAAPGRVNLIGEHTDYNDGFVLPMAIERHALILAALRDDQTIQLSTTVEKLDDVSFACGQDDAITVETQTDNTWANYLKGVMAGFVQRGVALPGMDVLIASTVPSGGGLSSSAALEVSMATLLEQVTGHQLDPVDKALLCQKAEHDYADVPCGIMDQFISAMAVADHALLIDCRSHETQAIALSDPAVSVLIINSNVKHALVDGEYRQRREQCEQASAGLEVKALRDADMTMLEAARTKLDETVYRRARHVITENQRTVHAAQALQTQAWQRAGELMFESHASMRDDYEITVEPIDLLVKLANEFTKTGEVYGSRMTGGGFGGCTVTLVRTDAAQAVCDSILQNYQKQTGIEATAFITRPAAGTGALVMA